MTLTVRDPDHIRYLTPYLILILTLTLTLTLTLVLILTLALILTPTPSLTLTLILLHRCWRRDKYARERTRTEDSGGRGRLQQGSQRVRTCREGVRSQGEQYTLECNT